MASLVDQIFMQAQAGSAQGQGFGQFFAEGVKQGQEKQRIDIAKQQLAMELAQAPLKQTLLQQTAEKQALDIQLGLQSRDNYLRATKAFATLQERLTPLLEDGQIGEARNVAVQSGLADNFLFNDPRYKELDAMLRSSEHEANVASYQHELSQARLKAADTSAFKAKPLYERLIIDADAADAEGDTERAELLRGQAALEKQKLDVRQGELDARRERTKAIQARTESLSRSLSQVDRIAMQSELRSIDDRPESKMPYEEKVKLKEAVHEKYASRAKTQNAPTGAAPINTTAPAAAKVHVRSPDGKLYLLPRSQLDEAIKQGYKPE